MFGMYVFVCIILIFYNHSIGTEDNSYNLELNRENLEFSEDTFQEIRSGWKFYYGSLFFEGDSNSEDCFYLKKENRFRDTNCSFSFNESHPYLKGQAGIIVSIPYSWKEHEKNIEKSNRGYGTFIYDLNLPLKNNIAIYTKTEALYSAFRIWGESLEGYELLYSRGRVSTLPEKEVALLSPIFFSSKNATWNRIIVEVSNYNYNRDAFWVPLTIGSTGAIKFQHQFNNYREMIVVGILFMTGLYHLIIYYLRTKLKSTLWFGISCLLFSLRVFIMNRTFEQLFPDNIYFDSILKLEYISLSLIISSILLYFYFFFDRLQNQKFITFFISNNIILSLIFLFSNSYRNTTILIILQVNILLIAIYVLFYLIKFSLSDNLEIKKNARVVILISGVFVFTAIHDILMYQGFFRSLDLSGFGLVIFSVGQAFVLAKMNSYAWKNSEYLSKKLGAEVERQTLQLRIEKEKAEDTLAELRISQNLLSRAESKAAMSQISAHLAHEINNPLNYISNGNMVIKNNLEKLKRTLIEVTEGDESAKEFYQYCNELISKSFESLGDQNLGKKKITEMVSEIRAISGVDGFGFEIIFLSSFLQDEVEKIKEIHQKKDLNLIMSSEISDTFQFTTNRYIFSRAIRTISSVLFTKGAEGFSFELSTMINSDSKKLYFFEFLGENLKLGVEPGIFSEKHRESGVGIIDLKLIKQILTEIGINISVHTKENKQGFLLIIPENYGNT